MGPAGIISCNSECNIQEPYDCSYDVLSNSVVFVKKNGYYQGLWRKGESDADFRKQGDKPSKTFDDDYEWHFHCMTISAQEGKIRSVLVKMRRNTTIWCFRYYKDNEMVKPQMNADFGYDVLSEGSYHVYVGRMAQETDAQSASEVDIFFTI